MSRIVSDPRIEPFFSGIDDFVAKHLPSSSEEPTTQGKVIADPVEGYSTLNPWEIAIVDTPLFQRLRDISQLGVAFLVYPTLGYSRFEHTIGVLARSSQVLHCLKENHIFREHETPHLPTDYHVNCLRLAMLFHDIGHCLYSHVTESVISNLPGNAEYPSADTILKAFAQQFGRHIPMAEVLAVSILNSQATVRFLKELGIPSVARAGKVEKLARDASRVIMGLPIEGDANSLYLGQLMSSGLDIDKLDYMMREALLSGISLGISLEWLLKKMFVTYLPMSQLPEGLRPRTGGFAKDTTFAVLALERGGQFAFEEFCVARLSLHEKIYLHQKIRAAEAQLKQALRDLSVQTPGYEKIHSWLWLKESVIDQDDCSLPNVEESTLFEKKDIRTDWRRGMRLVKSRRLLSRAYAFGWLNSIADPVQRHDRRLAVDELMVLAATNPNNLKQSIAKCLSEMKLILNRPDISMSVDSIAIDPPRESTIQQGHYSIHIEYPARLSFKWTMPIDRIEEYYHHNRAIGYIFAERSRLSAILIAAEKVAWEQCRAYCVQDGFVSRSVVEEAQRLRVELNKAGFYDKTPMLKPVTAFLLGAEAQFKVAKIATELSVFESRDRTRVSPASITSFVAQFPDLLQDAALHWISQLRMIRPDELVRVLLPSAIRQRVTNGNSRVGLSPLGSMTDSATRMGYDFRDVEDTVRGTASITMMGLPEALSRRQDLYVLYDDNTNSGLQALNIFAEWCGISLSPGLQLNESHVQPLPQDLKEELLAKHVLLCFAVSSEGACARLKKYLINEVGFSEDRLDVISERDLPLQKRVFAGGDSEFQHNDKVALRDFVQSIGERIFISEGKSPDVARRRALGDGDAQAMVVFPYNCPTMTVPALWLTGLVAGVEWVPLIPRGRRYHPDSGQFVGEDA